MRWHNRSLPAGVKRALAWATGTSGELVSRQTAPPSPGGPFPCQQPPCSVQLAVHGSTIPWGEQYLGGVAVLPASRVATILLALPPILTHEQVTHLADRAMAQLRPAS
jgi:hypothetical protein